MNYEIKELLKEWNKVGIKIKPQDIVNIVKDTIHFKTVKKALEVFNYYASLWNATSITNNEVSVTISHDNLKLEINKANEFVLVDNKPRLIINFSDGIERMERDMVNLIDDLYKPIEFTKYDMLLGNGIRLVASPLYE